MVFAAVLVQALLATAAFASPAERRANRIARRASGIHQSRPLQVSDGALGSLANNASHVSYSSNWSGAVLNSAAVSFISSSFSPTLQASLLSPLFFSDAANSLTDYVDNVRRGHTSP